VALPFSLLFCLLHHFVQVPYFGYFLHHYFIITFFVLSSYLLPCAWYPLPFHICMSWSFWTLNININFFFLKIYLGWFPPPLVAFIIIFVLSLLFILIFVVDLCFFYYCLKENYFSLSFNYMFF
jgi:hypothetical protein